MTGQPQELGPWDILAIRSANAQRLEGSCESGEGFIPADPDRHRKPLVVSNGHRCASTAAQ